MRAEMRAEMLDATVARLRLGSGSARLVEGEDGEEEGEEEEEEA